MSPKKRKAPFVERPPFLTKEEFKIGAFKKIDHWEYKNENKRGETISKTKHLTGGRKIITRTDGSQYYLHSDGTRTEKTK
ncbi:MAG: hypothetical protein EBU69_01085 [Methylophilaceae bacterium]|nr:hypothetical protein [Methylophilaceae bacterium]